MTVKSNQIKILALACVFALSACGKDKGDDQQSMNQGDPKALVANTRMNDNEPIRLAVFQENSDWALEVKGFSELPGVNLESEFKGGIGAKLGANPSEKIFGYEPYRMIRSQQGLWTVFQPSNSASLRIELNQTNSKSAGSVGTTPFPVAVITKVFLNNVDLFEKEQYSVLHTSFTDANDAFSVLLYSSKPGNRRLVALYFYRWNKAAAPVSADVSAGDSLNYESAVTDGQLALEKPFNYLYGQSFKAVWDRKVDLKVCMNSAPEVQNVVIGAIDQWLARVDGGMNLKRAPAAECFPFSDLRQQTLVFVDGWNPVPNHAGRIYGTTVNVANLGTSRLLDGDVMLFMSEVQKNLPVNKNVYFSLDEPGIRSIVELTSLKSIGFLLGLGEAPSATQSIMSNDAGRNGVTDYDKEAIFSLYPNDNAFFSTLNKWL